jgi:hypothetical protein
MLWFIFRVPMVWIAGLLAVAFFVGLVVGSTPNTCAFFNQPVPQYAR